MLGSLEVKVSKKAYRINLNYASKCRAVWRGPRRELSQSDGQLHL
jgi:sigma54-dependent transcription regulator